ncbi:MAG: class I SAM-dependent methyltransferase [Patescibacteria group bacterium]
MLTPGNEVATSLAPPLSAAVRCAICGSADEQVVDVHVSGGHSIRDVQCLRCGHVYLSPRESAEAYDAYYRQQGFSKNCNNVSGEDDPSALARSAEKKTQRIYRFLEPELRPGLRVLEIGCGYGNLLARIRESVGGDVTGIEPDPIGPVVARSVFHLEIASQTLEQFLVGWNGKPFDLILMHHVLEHFLDIDVVGDALEMLLAPGGRVYLGLPNVTAMTFPKRFFFRFPHVSNFTPYSFLLFLWRHDLKIVRLDNLGRPLSAIVASRIDAAPMVAAFPLVTASLSPGRVRRSIALCDIHHTIRLFIRDHRGKLLPAPLKRAVKTLIRK